MWKLTAENMGIDVEWKDRLQLAKELFSSMPDTPQANPISDSNDSEESLDDGEEVK
jgi:hypothetical protein